MSNLSVRQAAKRRLRREVYGGAAVVFLLLLAIVLLLTLFNRGQLQLVTDLMVSALCLLPALLCLLPLLLLAFVGSWGVGRLQHSAEASLIRAEHGAQDIRGRISGFARLAASHAANIGVRLAWLDPLLSAFDPKPEQQESQEEKK